MFKWMGKANCLLVISFLLLAELVINPIGEFPLNDDWAYSKTIATYINSGVLKFSDWQAIPLIPQYIIGISLTKLFGFSFTILRSISILSLIIITLVFDNILKEFNIKSSFRLVILFCFVFNPLTLSLSNTFLPDAFTILLTLVAFLFMIRLYKNFSLGNTILFTFFSILATMNRQTGLVLPLAFGIVYFSNETKSVKGFIKGFGPAIINIITLILYEYIAIKIKKLPGNYHLQSSHILHSIIHPDFELAKIFLYYFVTSTILLGLFIIPLTFSNIKYHFNQIYKSNWAKIVFGLYFLLILFKVVLSKNIFPFVGNMFYPLGVGPVILTGFDTNELNATSVYSHIFWIILNFTGGLSFYMAFMSIICKAIWSRNKELKFIFALFLLLFILYLVPICLSYANDRYLLFLLPFFLLIYTLSFDFKINKLWFALAFFTLTFFSITSTHDYLTINKARWKATDHLTNDLSISPTHIDGGFEFNGWHSSNSKKYIASHKGRWWWIDDDMYIITPILIKGYEIESEYGFSSWISFEFKNIYVLKRKKL